VLHQQSMQRQAHDPSEQQRTARAAGPRLLLALLVRPTAALRVTASGNEARSRGKRMPCRSPMATRSSSRRFT
jgi:hypothetical protein